jgi:hypothetical protein
MRPFCPLRSSVRVPLVLLSAAKLYQHNSITVILLHLLPHRVLVTMCYAQGHHISPPLILPPLRVLYYYYYYYYYYY